MSAQLAMVVGAACLLAVSFVHPIYTHEQVLQHAPTPLILLGMAYAAHRRWFSNAAMICLTTMVLLHVIGGRWIYSFVPYQRWCDAVLGSGPNEWFGWTRNHYDRFVHLAFGLTMVLPAAEALIRWRRLKAADALAGAVLIVCAASAAYEVFEWVLAITAAPAFADRYNGQQGDAWDAQKDMALAMLGAAVTAAALAAAGWRRPDDA